MPPLAAAFAAVAMLMLGPLALAQSGKPQLPPGRDPGGVAVAVLTTGIDYTLPHVARALARDGEGDLIGFDLVDNDNRPYGDDTALAAGMLDPPVGIRLVPVRVDPRNPVALARAVAFVAQTPARILAVPMRGTDGELWRPFRQALERFPQVLVIAGAGDDGRDLDREPVWPAALGLPNLLVVTAGSFPVGEETSVRLHKRASWGAKTVDAVADGADSAIAIATATKAAAIVLAGRPGLAGADLKTQLTEQSKPAREGEPPQRTRTLAVIAPANLKLTRPPLAPADRILDKSRVPERIHRPGTREPGSKDGKTR